MRTNIDIDADLMANALKAGPYKTGKEAVEAGLRLRARQAAYREVLEWRGKLQWQGDDWAEPEVSPPKAPESKPATKGAARNGRR